MLVYIHTGKTQREKDRGRGWGGGSRERKEGLVGGEGGEREKGEEGRERGLGGRQREREMGGKARERESINKLYFYGGLGGVMKRQTDRQVGRERRFSNWILTSCAWERERDR